MAAPPDPPTGNGDSGGGDNAPIRHRLEQISPKAYEHPADRAATAALQAIPMLDTVVRRLIEFGYERVVRQAHLGGSVKVGPEQLPALYAGYRSAVDILDLEPEHDVYVWQAPYANAHTIGATKPYIVVNSGLYSLLDDDERRVVVAHEVGHILSKHVLYRTALYILLNIGVPRVPLLSGLPLLAVRLALLEWSRAGELTCDRAATLVVRDPLVVCRALMTMAAGVPSRDLSLDAFLAQAMAYREWGDELDRTRRLLGELRMTHSFPVRRAHEVMTWVQGGDYDRILRGEYVRRGEEPPAREVAGDAVEHYAQRFRDIFRDAGEGVERLGERFNDWLRRDSDGGAGSAGSASGDDG
jgi:Zn-dependent protease with chaperone function